MDIFNMEIKSKCMNHDAARSTLQRLNAEFKGIDHQIDTYFRVPNGRLKLREGNFEQTLIYYFREDRSEPKPSKVLLYQTNRDLSLKEILSRSLGILVIVDKMREVYFIDNIKFHLDNVKFLGTFMEIEAIDKDGTIGREKLEQQCHQYIAELNIQPSQLIALSYSDLLYRLWKRPM